MKNQNLVESSSLRGGRYARRGNLFGLGIDLRCWRKMSLTAQDAPRVLHCVRNDILVLIMFFALTGGTFACECCDKNSDLVFANQVMAGIQKDVSVQIEQGYGPFLAAIYDKNGKCIAKMPNTVIKDQCSLNHAEVNTIREAQRVLGTYDLSKYDLTLYSSAEPCIMCTGAIMWSGIKHVYYGVCSKDVEMITGFDEGYKPDWEAQFAKRGIIVKGGIQVEEGKKALSKYVRSGHHVYKPSRE